MRMSMIATSGLLSSTARTSDGPLSACATTSTPDPLLVSRRISARGAIMIGGQRIQVGLPHAGKTLKITVESDTYQIAVEPGITITAPRTTSRDIRRHKASNYD
jgi:hypothetical protein